ncbi:MAG: efflux RND transporter periplasmic adaptor subunit [Woeseiaceae bacterium]
MNPPIQWSFTLLLAVILSMTACSRNHEPTAANQAAALAVSVQVLESQDSYQAVQRYSGQVEAARQSSLGFDLGGSLSDVRVDEGASIKAGDILAVLDQRRILAAQSEANAALEQAMAQVALSDATYERISGARAFDGVSQQELDEATELRARTRAAAAAAKARVVRIDVDLAKSTLRAPYDAAVVRRHVDEGQVVAAGQPILDIQEFAALRVRLSVSGDVVNVLQAGATLSLLIDDQSVQATVLAVIPRRNSRTRAIEVIFELDPGAAARVGDIAELSAERLVVQQGYWLPLDALSEGARSVWQVLAVMPLDERDSALARNTGATHRLENRPVEVLYEEADRVFARGALRDGDNIVANGLQRVVNGQGVRIADDGLRESASAESVPAQ